VTVVVEYSDYEFYDIKNTVDSCVIVHTPVDDEGSSKSLISQIIAVDSSTLDYIIDEVQNFIACAPAMLRAGIVFGGVCLSVCPHKISKTTDQKLM